MEQYTTKSEATPVLLHNLWSLLMHARPAFSQERVFRRAVALFFGELFTLDRHPVTQLLRALGATETDPSAWYRIFSEERFSESQASRQLFQETLVDVPPEDPYVTTVDAVLLPRSGSHMAGSSWWVGKNTAPFHPGLARAQRFVEITCLTPEQDSYVRAIPLRWLPAPTAKAVPCAAPVRKEWEAGLENLRWARQELDQQGRAAEELVAVMDGTDDTQGIWKDLPPRTVALVRCARNRALWELPPGRAEPPGAGHPVWYGDRLPAPHQYLRPRSALRPLTLRIRGKDRHLPYRVVGPVLVEGAPRCPLFLLVVGGHSKKAGTRRVRTYNRDPAYYLVNARRDAHGHWVLPYPVEQLLRWAWQRWECEVGHREMKSALGIGEKQCWGETSALTSVQWGVWVYGICVLGAYRTWGITGGPRRSGRWCRSAQRWSLSGMWQAYRSEVWGYSGFSPLYAEALDKWLEKETWMTGMRNAVASAARI